MSIHEKLISYVKLDLAFHYNKYGTYRCPTQAIEDGRQYPEYIWLTPGWYQGGWWRDDEDYLLSLNCSLTSLQQQLDRSLALLAHPNNVRE